MLNKKFNSLKKRFISFLMIVLTIASIVPAQNVQAAHAIDGGQAFATSSITVYSDVDLTTTKGTIYKSEGFTILYYYDARRVYVEYSGSSGAKKGYVDLWNSNIAYQDSFTCVAKVNTSANVYYGNNTSNYVQAGSVSSGEYVVVLAKSGSWSYIEYNTPGKRKRGYVKTSKLTLYNEPSSYSLWFYLNRTPADSSFYISGSHTVYTGPTTKYATAGSVSNENVVLYKATVNSAGATATLFIEYTVSGSSQKKTGFIVYNNPF